MNYDFDKRLNEARAFIDMNKLEKARDIIAGLIEGYSDQGELYYLLSICDFNEGNYESAKELCAESIRLGANEEISGKLMGKVCLCLGQYKEAEDSLLNTIRINPQNGGAIAAYGWLMFITGFYEKADILFAESLRVDNLNDDVLHYNFLYYLAKDNTDGQFTIIHNNFSLLNDQMQGLIKLGLMKMYNKNYKEAKEVFREAFLMEPENYHVLKLLQYAEYHSHCLFIPKRLTESVGGWPVLIALWFIGIYIFGSLKMDGAISFLMYLLLLGIVYFKCSPFIYKILSRRW